jgi:hypothetical protein
MPIRLRPGLLLFVKESRMTSEFAQEIFALIDARSQIRPTPTEFEMAYQARVAIDRIRFAIRHTEQLAPRTDQMREVDFQLLDALQKLEAVDRRFQSRCRVPSANDAGDNYGRLGRRKSMTRSSMPESVARRVHTKLFNPMS